jgi:adenylate kinase family enzyme
MTLIITAKSQSHVIVTADGRCSTITAGVQKKKSDILQKIFPMYDRGFAIAHHGENIIKECKIDDIIDEFFNKRPRITSIRQIAQDFKNRYDADIRKTLTMIKDSKACGFLFIGFGTVMRKSKICEAFWSKQNDNTIVNKLEELGDIVLSGDAQKYIKKYLDDTKEKALRQEKIAKGNIQDAQTYCNRLYRFAEIAQAEANEDIFGGYKHQLLVTSKGCEWLLPPKTKDINI